MNPADRNAPLSPVSVGGSEWSFAKRPTHDEGPFPHRGHLASPPSSGGSPENMSMNGFLNSPRSASGPSPPPSVGRSSNGTNMYPRNNGPHGRPRPDSDELILGDHYRALKVYLTARDPNIRQPPNKARDKLLRLSAEQFFELSTDVFDELMRRQALARIPPNAPNLPPNYLLPEKTFHPKRNQARQRLASLGPPRFRDLGADVFRELERRYPHFVAGDIPRVGSSMSNRSGPMGRVGTPVNGAMFPPRGESRMRSPSEAGSMRGGGGPAPMDPYGIPGPSSHHPNGDYARPMARQPNHSNTIIPNKSTMVEEDDEGGDDFHPDDSVNRESKRMSAMTSETDKKLIEEYQVQVRELREKLDSMEDSMKRKEDELTSALDLERSRVVTMDSEKQDWQSIRSDLEFRLNETQTLNESLRQELERAREDHDRETHELREQVQQSARQLPPVDEELKQENDKLRHSLQQQQQVTEEVRTEAQVILHEMRLLSQQSASTYEKQAEMEKTLEQLERDARDWRNRYARAKTRLRNLQGYSEEPMLDNANAAKHVGDDEGFVDGNGLVKDVHVTKFQMAVDELLQRSRREAPGQVIEAMKSVVVSVRRIMRDIDESTPQGNDPDQLGKLRAKVSATANSLITASKNFASSAGLAPVSLVDAAASHLTVAIVDLLRAVKIRSTPAEELEDEDDHGVTPVDSTGFFRRSTTQESDATEAPLPPPADLGSPGGIGESAESSAYSPVGSRRASVDEGYTKDVDVTTTGSGYAGHNPMPPADASGHGMHQRDDSLEDLKIYLEDQNALLVSDIQNLVNSVRSEADIAQISREIGSIADIVDQIMSQSQRGGFGTAAIRLATSRSRLLEAEHHGQELTASGIQRGDGEWRGWAQTLPPMAFEIARESKELVQRVGRLASSDADDFS